MVKYATKKINGPKLYLANKRNSIGFVGVLCFLHDCSFAFTPKVHSNEKALNRRFVRRTLLNCFLPQSSDRGESEEMKKDKSCKMYRIDQRSKALLKQSKHFVLTKQRAFSLRCNQVSGPISESRTIVVTSGKGGVGKTTTTANLGMSIARLGYRVALIDADIGLRNLDLLLGLENRVLYTAMDIFEGECRLDQALIRDKRLKNLSLLAISKNRQRYNVTRQKMESLVSSIAALGYQFVLIDCPAGIDVGFINAISPAQEALIVTTPEITAMRDADRVAGLLEANGIYNAKLLINRVRPDMIQRHDMMSVQDVQDVLGIPLLGAIPEDLNVIVSTNRGEPLVLRKKLTLSGIAFENAARRLIGKQDYVIDVTTPYKSFFQKIQSIFTE